MVTSLPAYHLGGSLAHSLGNNWSRFVLKFLFSMPVDPCTVFFALGLVLVGNAYLGVKLILRAPSPVITYWAAVNLTRAKKVQHSYEQ